MSEAPLVGGDLHVSAVWYGQNTERATRDGMVSLTLSTPIGDLHQDLGPLSAVSFGRARSIADRLGAHFVVHHALVALVTSWGCDVSCPCADCSAKSRSGKRP